MASSSSSNKKQRLEEKTGGEAASSTKAHVYKIWPSSLSRAGHTTLRVEDPKEPLYQFFENQVSSSERYNGIHMGRMQKDVPCLLVQSSKFRHGAERWWCPVHQGQYGLKAQLLEHERNPSEPRRCDCATDPVDFVRLEDIPIFTLSDPSTSSKDDDMTSYCELGIWIGLPPAINTRPSSSTNGTAATRFFPGIHVHGRKVPGGKKVVDTNFPAVTIRDTTGRFPQLSNGEGGVTITSPAALEFLYYMENQCPVNQSLRMMTDKKQKKSSSTAKDKKKGEAATATAPSLPRTGGKELVQDVKCKHCGALHEDVGDFFGENLHKKHLCGQCGRSIFGPQPNIGNPLMAFRREYKREIVGGGGVGSPSGTTSSGDGMGSPEDSTTNSDKENNDNLHLAKLDLSTDEYHVMMWPSTPAIFWSRDPSPEVWGIHVHAYDQQTGECMIDDTYGEVWLDGSRLDRSKLFQNMIDATKWVSDPNADPTEAEELEDD